MALFLVGLQAIASILSFVQSYPLCQSYLHGRYCYFKITIALLRKKGIALKTPSLRLDKESRVVGKCDQTILECDFQ